jgi:hypothetical protein
MESALEKWLGANAAATKGPWNRWDGFWLLSEGRRVHLRFRFDGVIEIALHEGPACKGTPVSGVEEAVRLVDLFLRQGCALAELPGTAWKTFWHDDPIPASMIDHPERMTMEEIDNQSDRRLRDAMIECYGTERYWHEVGLKPTGLIYGSRDIAAAIDHWRASSTREVQVSRETLCEGDPRNEEELLIVRFGSRQAVFGEPSVWQDYRVFVSVSEGNATKRGYISRREEVVRLVDCFLGRLCRFDELPNHGWESLWRQIRVPDYVIDHPERITVTDIENESNAEVRGAKMERYGFENYVRDAKLKVVQQDAYGKLYRRNFRRGVFRRGVTVAFVEVRNATPEPDGTYKHFILPVPSRVRTAHEAVAATFGLRAAEYGPSAES